MLGGRRPSPLLIFIIALAVIGGGLYVLNLYRDQLMALVMPEGKASVTVATPVTTTGSVPKVTTPMVGSPKPISVCVVTWGGYAGGQYFNGGFQASKESRFYKDYGIMVDFRLIDDYAASREAWKSGECQLLWTTADSLPVEAGELAPVQIMQADWSRDGDKIMVTRGINTVADLKGKKVALVLGTPSHTLLLFALEAGGLEPKDIEVIAVKQVPEATAAIKAGVVDAAVVWSPDDEDIAKSVAGSKVLAGTGKWGFIIADTFYAKRAFVDNNLPALTALVEGWLRGNAEINTDPKAKEAAVKILAAGLNQPETFVAQAIGNVRLATYGDNVNFFNLHGNYDGVKGEDLYDKMTRVYGKLGLAKSAPPWRATIDLRILRAIKLEGPQHAAEGAARFTPPTRAEAQAPAVAVKKVSVNFATGSSTLDDNAKQVIDISIGQLARNLRDTRVRVEGNTDDIGGDKVNQPLSERRAKAVVAYLVEQYKFDPNRFIVIGNGSTKPDASNATESGRAKNRRTDFEFLN